MAAPHAAAYTNPAAELPPPARSFGYRLWMLRHAWTRRLEAALAPTALTHMQFVILCAVEHLTGQGSVPSQTDVADAMQIDRMTVSKVVRTLEAKGLLARAVHPDDPRAKHVALTIPGATMTRRARAMAHAEQERFFDRLGRTNKEAFSLMLDTLLEQDPASAETPTLEEHVAREIA